MEKINKKLIIDYINGNDIKNYSIEELEENKDFMMSVISLSNDEKFYNLCGDNIKKDYEFVKYLVLKFKNKIDFICDVADYYLDNTENELEEMEIIIIMSKLTEQDKEKQSKYRILSETMVTAKRVQIEMAKIEVNDDYASNEIGMGFLIVYDSYNSSKIVLDFYAKSFIDEIIKEYDINLESMLHEQFRSAEDIDKRGINNYMLSFISCYDSMLSSYLSTNIELMSNLKSRIQLVQKNWDRYITTNERIKYNTIFDKVHEYMEQIGENVSFSETNILYYIGKKLGIMDKIAKYDYLDEFQINTIKEEMEDEFFEELLISTPQDNFCYKTLMRIVSSIAFDNKYDEPIEPNENKDTKILRINFKKNK